MDPKKHGINMKLKYMSDFRALGSQDHVQCSLLFKSSQISKLDFLAKNCSCYNSTVYWMF